MTLISRNMGRFCAPDTPRCRANVLWRQRSARRSADSDPSIATPQGVPRPEQNQPHAATAMRRVLHATSPDEAASERQRLAPVLLHHNQLLYLMGVSRWRPSSYSSCSIVKSLNRGINFGSAEVNAAKGQLQERCSSQLAAKRSPWPEPPQQ